MNYELKNATDEQIELLIEYKMRNIMDYASDLDKEEKARICEYVKKNVPLQIN